MKLSLHAIRYTSIENPTLAHFRHFSSLLTNFPLYICREPSTNHPFLCKTNPISSKGKLMQTQYLQRITKISCSIRAKKQSQYKPNSNPIKPNCRKAQMNVNSLITKDYRKNDDFAVQQNKPNSNPKQTQSKPVLSVVEWANFIVLSIENSRLCAGN